MMKIFSIVIFISISVFAFFASADTLPSWVHNLNAIGLDKPVHTLIFGIGFLQWAWIDKRTYPLSIALVLVHIGLTIELLQHFYALGRTFSWSDVVANSIGILIALILSQLFKFLNFKLL